MPGAAVRERRSKPDWTLTHSETPALAGGNGPGTAPFAARASTPDLDVVVIHLGETLLRESARPLVLTRQRRHTSPSIIWHLSYANLLAGSVTSPISPRGSNDKGCFPRRLGSIPPPSGAQIEQRTQRAYSDARADRRQRTRPRGADHERRDTVVIVHARRIVYNEYSCLTNN